MPERCNSTFLTKDNLITGHATAKSSCQLASRISSQTGNYLHGHEAQSQPSLDRPAPQKQHDRIIVIYERGRNTRPKCPTRPAGIRVSAVHPPEQPQIIDPNPAT